MQPQRKQRPNAGLYSFDKKLDLLFQNYFKLYFRGDCSKQNTETILKHLDELELQNLIYKVALSSADHDLNRNEQQQIDLQYEISNCKSQIEEMQEEYRLHRLQQDNKKRYNQIGQQLKSFDTSSNLDSKMAKLSQQMEESESRFNQDMQKYEKQKQLLRVSHSALMNFCKLSANPPPKSATQHPQQLPQRPPAPMN